MNRTDLVAAWPIQAISLQQASGGHGENV